MSNKCIVVDQRFDLFEVSGNDLKLGKYIGSLFPEQFASQQSYMGLTFSIGASLGMLTEEVVQEALDNLDTLERNIKEHREFLCKLKDNHFPQVS